MTRTIESGFSPAGERGGHWGALRELASPSVERTFDCLEEDMEIIKARAIAIQQKYRVC